MMGRYPSFLFFKLFTTLRNEVIRPFVNAEILPYGTILLLVRLDSKGPIFFRQQRVTHA